MTISGFFLQINRNSADLVSSASCSSVLQEAVASSSSESEMVCPHAAAPSCHGKLTLIAAGLLVGGAAIGYFIGQKLAKNKARCNHHVKLNTDKLLGCRHGRYRRRRREEGVLPLLEVQKVAPLRRIPYGSQQRIRRQRRPPRRQRKACAG
uniref:Transmembrane protein n=1 Tax=Panagrellus redivivus TaxID=6233 RepID=A0A7E4ZSB1_PANRE